ncbi:unnamed protein product [Knipowitschia caucasica]
MAALRFGQYFKMRRNRLGKEDWIHITWKPGNIPHTHQQDPVSCGVFVMQMVKVLAMSFPHIPKGIQVETTKKAMGNLRKEMAEEILRMSVSDLCSLCGLQNSATGVTWIQCDNFQGWFHIECVAMAQEDIPDQKMEWKCQWC